MSEPHLHPHFLFWELYRQPWLLCLNEASLGHSSKCCLQLFPDSVFPLEAETRGGGGGTKKKKANKWEFSRISKQSNQRATFRTSHLGSETPSCPGVPAEPAAKHSSWRSCHWLQAIREDALATNVQSMINLFLFILMLLQLQQMFKCLLAVTYPRMVLNPYQASNDKSHRFLGLCQLEWFFFLSPLESSAYFLEVFLVRYDVFMPYICSVPQFTWVDQRAGKNFLLYKDTNLELPSGEAAERWYKGHRTCRWCILRLSEARFMQCDRCMKTGMKDQCTTSNHNFILQQNSELTVSSVTARWGGSFLCIAAADIGEQLNNWKRTNSVPTKSLQSLYAKQELSRGAIPWKGVLISTAGWVT